MLKREQLHEYQVNTINFAKEKLKCGLFLDMGMGKTVSSLTIASDLLEAGTVKRVLIIAPLRVANTVWKQEIDCWEHLKHLKAVICTGDNVSRIKSFAKDADIHVINRDNVKWLAENIPWKWDMVIIDESSSFKSHATNRFRALKAQLKYLKSIIILTGTPMPNGIHDLWSQLFLIDNGKRLGKKITAYREKYFTPGYIRGTYNQNAGSQRIVENKIDDICISMKAIDHLTLPERVDIIEYIDMPNQIKSDYKKLQKELVIELELDTEIAVDNAAVLTNKLMQMCNGAIYDEDGGAHILHSEKVDALAELVEENSSENFLVAYNFKSDLERLKERFPKAVTISKGGEEIDQWNNGHIRMLLVHPASAGHGLNLQHGGSVVVWFGLTWSLELYQQLNGRLHRQGQKHTVRVIHIVARNCIDETVMNAIKEKSKNQTELIDNLRYALKNWKE
jgi:SNF2 family DNA or RNA helicase